MLVLFIRSILIYIIVLLVMRLMGKREIGQLQPFELVISIIIADLAAIPISNSGIPLTNGIITNLKILVMDLIISVGNIKSLKFRQMISGKPSILKKKKKMVSLEEIVSQKTLLSESIRAFTTTQETSCNNSLLTNTCSPILSSTRLQLKSCLPQASRLGVKRTSKLPTWS